MLKKNRTFRKKEKEEVIETYLKAIEVLEEKSKELEKSMEKIDGAKKQEDAVIAIIRRYKDLGYLQGYKHAMSDFKSVVAKRKTTIQIHRTFDEIE